MKKLSTMVGAVLLLSCEIQEICDCEIVTYEVEYSTVLNPDTGLLESSFEFVEISRECTNFDDPTTEEFQYNFGDEIVIQKQCPNE